MTKPSPRERLIVALDVPNRADALHLLDQLSGAVKTFKIGKQLFTAEGPGLVREVVDSGAQVFLDLKYHDIPNTVAGAVDSASRIGVFMLNVHASGGLQMMKAAVQAAAQAGGWSNDAAAAAGSYVSDGGPMARPAVLGVTVLTSMDQAVLASVGVAGSLDEQVVRLAALAKEAGLDGVVASPREISLIRNRIAGENFLIVTPGVRPEWAEAGDQRRMATPSQAIRDGADYIVVGRPIIAAADPKAAAERVLEEIG